MARTDYPATGAWHEGAPHGSRRFLRLERPVALDSSRTLQGVTIAYETWGTPNAERSNAVLLCHAWTGDSHAAGPAEDGHPTPGWWEDVVGPGLAIDTERWFVVCSNVIGGCQGSTGPASPHPDDGQPYGMRFPVITIRDMVRAEVALLDALGIDQLHAVVGGSMGGMQALSFAANWPERTRAVLVLASTARHSAQNIAFHEVGRQAIMADPKWEGGSYYGKSKGPENGLAVARMAAHITYLSEAGLTEKFGRRLQDRTAKTFGFDADFQVESYLRHQGLAFTDRFDANSYLYITRAMDYFDLAEEHGGRLAEAFRGSKARFCLVSFDTDWLYPTAESRVIAHALNAAGAPVSFVELSAPFGHDSFLLDVPAQDRVIAGFLGQ